MASCSQSTYHTKLDHYPMATDGIIAVPIKRIPSSGQQPGQFLDEQ